MSDIERAMMDKKKEEESKEEEGEKKDEESCVKTIESVDEIDLF